MIEGGRRSHPPKGRTAAAAWSVVLAWTLVRILLLPQGDGSPRQAAMPRRRASKAHAPPAAADQAGRGREAASPPEIPAPGWKDVAWRVIQEFRNDRIMSVAAGVTYYTLLALFPALAAIVSVYGFFGDPITTERHVATLAALLRGLLESSGRRSPALPLKAAAALGSVSPWASAFPCGAPMPP